MWFFSNKLEIHHSHEVTQHVFRFTWSNTINLSVHKTLDKPFYLLIFTSFGLHRWSVLDKPLIHIYCTDFATLFDPRASPVLIPIVSSHLLQALHTPWCLSVSQSFRIRLCCPHLNVFRSCYVLHTFCPPHKSASLFFPHQVLLRNLLPYLFLIKTFDCDVLIFFLNSIFISSSTRFTHFQLSVRFTN